MVRKPDYSKLGVDLYLGRWQDVLPEIDLSGIGLLATDPPFGINHPVNYHQRKRDCLAACKDYPEIQGDSEPFDPAPLLALNLPAILWGANHYASKLPDSSGWLVWDKRRPDDLDQATCELAWTNFVKGVRRFEYLWHGMIRDGYDEIIHPMQKPVALIEWCLSLRWTPPGMVLDCYAGSGSTCIACIRKERKCIAVECNEVYFNSAVSRIERETNRTPLFHD